MIKREVSLIVVMMFLVVVLAVGVVSGENQLCRRYADNNGRASATWACEDFGEELWTDFTSNDVDENDDFDLRVDVDSSLVRDSCDLCARQAKDDERASATWACEDFGTELNTDFAYDMNKDTVFDLKVDCDDVRFQSACQLCRRYADRNRRASASWTCVDFDGSPLNTDFIGDVDENDDFDLKIECPGGLCECSAVGEEGCDGTNYLTCDDGCMWKDNGQVAGECGYFAPIDCSDEQTMFRISQPSGALGQVWDYEANPSPSGPVCDDSQLEAEWAATCQPGWIDVGVIDEDTDGFLDLNEGTVKNSDSRRLCLKSDCDFQHEWQALGCDFANDWVSTGLTDDSDVCGLNEHNYNPQRELCLKSDESVIEIEWAATCQPGWIDTLLKDCDLSDGHDCNEYSDCWNDPADAGYLCLKQTADSIPEQDSVYLIDICYDDIFGVNGDGDRECDGNEILYLSDVNDATASFEQDAEHDVAVCYGDLICSKEIGDCDEPYELIVSVDADGLLALDNSGAEKICCSRGAITGAQWEDMEGITLTEADLKDSVKLVVEGEGFEDRNVDFKIMECDTLCDWTGGLIHWGDDEVAQMSGMGFVVWKAGETGDGGFAQGDYYFKAEVEGIGSFESEVLEVGPESNDPPVAGIVNPVDRGIYFVGGQISFEQDSSDVDDGFNWTWNFNSEEVIFGESSDMVNYDVVHAFAGAGQKRIVLNVTDGRGAVDRAEVNILIVDAGDPDADYVLAYISEPEYGGRPEEFNVNFDGSLSYAVEMSASGLSCLGGACPAKTEGCSEVNPVYPDCRLDVVNSFSSPDYSALTFTWSFDDQTADKSYVGEPGVNHEYSTADPLRHVTGLKVEIEEASGETDVLFWIYPDGDCIGEFWYEGFEKYSSMTEANVCLGPDEDPETEDDCCPENHECVENRDGDYYCERKDECRGIFSCSDYANEDACDDDDCRKSRSKNVCGGSRRVTEACGVLIGDYISKPKTCKCFWDDNDTPDDESDDECKQKHDVVATTYSEIEVAGKYECIVDVGATECENGKMTVSKDVFVVWTEPAGITPIVKEACENQLCAGYTKTIDCGKPSLQLPFFSMINFVIVCFVLVVFYVVRGEILSRRGEEDSCYF